MKRLILSLFLILLMTLTGCVQKLETTQAQSDALAEYMAGLLLKYDAKYDKKLIPQMVEDNEDSRTDSQTDDLDNKDNSNKNNTDVPNTSGSTDDKANEEKQAYSLAELAGRNDYDISYLDYLLTDIYPENYNKAYFFVEADEGKQLLVIKFNIKNKTKDKINIDLGEAEIKYQLEIAGNKIDKPWFTVLENDLQYIDITLEAEAATDAVLIYQISKGADTGSMKLIASAAGKEMVIPVK